MNNNFKREPNFWIKGKLEQRKFYDIKLNRSTNIWTFILGLLLAVIIILPFGLMIYQYLIIYGYNLRIFIVYLLLIWIGLMFFNALSNYFTVKLAQSASKEMINLQQINANYIFWYQLLNIGFGLITLFLLIFFGINVIGAL